jgi:two-component SAPR family response regulator
MAVSSMRGDKDRDVRQAAGAAVEFLTSEGPATLRVLTLGGFEVWRGDDQILASEWGGRRTKDLFKLFVIHRHEPVVRDVIIETLWPDFALETALNNLNVTVSTLRRVLEPWLAPREPSSYIFSEDGSHRLNASELDLDVDRFTELGRRTLELVSARRWQETVQTGGAAAATYRGEFLPENRYDDWTTIERERLSHLYGQVLFATARGWAGVGRLEEACQVCRELLHLDPFGEEVHRSLMRYLALLGRRAEALHQFEECRRSLEGDLGVAVSGETLELHRRIQAGEPV